MTSTRTPERTTRVRGRVKWFGVDKGYGFVAGDDGRDYFLHSKDVKDHHARLPAADDRCTFTPEHTQRGWRAATVELDPV